MVEMNRRGKSDSSMVPEKRPNNAGEPVAEAVEGRVWGAETPSEAQASRCPPTVGLAPTGRSPNDGAPRRKLTL